MKRVKTPLNKTNHNVQRKKGLTFGNAVLSVSLLRGIFGQKKGTFKVKWSVFLLCAVLLMFSVQPSRAFLGFGDIVFDPSVFIQTVLGYVQQYASAVNTATQIENQVKSLYNEAQNLANMDQGAAMQTISGIRQSLTQLFQMQSRIRGMTMDYASVESAWDNLYKNFGAYNGMSGKDYAAQAQKILAQTDNATYDAMRAQGLVSQLGNDERNLESLLNASNSAAGALAAAQAGNQIAAVNTQQLMRLQQIVAASYRAESSYYAQQTQREAMSKADSDRFFKSTIQKPGDGKGRGTKQF